MSDITKCIKHVFQDFNNFAHKVNDGFIWTPSSNLDDTTEAVRLLILYDNILSALQDTNDTDDPWNKTILDKSTSLLDEIEKSVVEELNDFDISSLVGLSDIEVYQALQGVKP